MVTWHDLMREVEIKVQAVQCAGSPRERAELRQARAVAWAKSIDAEECRAIARGEKPLPDFDNADCLVDRPP